MLGTRVELPQRQRRLRTGSGPSVPGPGSQSRAARRRLGASFLELLTSLSILGLVLTIIVQSTLTSGRAFRETRRRDQALELCNSALEHVASVGEAGQPLDAAALNEIGRAVSQELFDVRLTTAPATGAAWQQVTATAQWTNDHGETHSLGLHYWQASTPTRDSGVEP